MRTCILFFVCLLPVLSSGTEIHQIRQEFYAAVNNEDAADKLYGKLKSMDLKDPLILAYFGSTEALRAKHAWNPYLKVSYLKNGMKNINQAVSVSPDNLEIRFLRFSLQHYIPSFLGFSKHLDEDRKKIVALVEKKQLGKVDKTLLRNIVSFMEETKRCSAAELSVFQQAL